MEVDALLDTGSLAGDFIAEDVVVVEVEEVINLPRFLLAQLLVEGLVELTGRVSAALFLLGQQEAR